MKNNQSLWRKNHYERFYSNWAFPFERFLSYLFLILGFTFIIGFGFNFGLELERTALNACSTNQLK